MHPVDGADVEAAKSVPALHAGSERDVGIIANVADADAGSETQVTVIRAQQHLGALPARIDRLLEHRILAGEQLVPVGG